MNILIINVGFIGDSLFAASLCENLKRSGIYNRVDLLIGFPQTLDVLKYNPFIDNVYLSNRIGSTPTTANVPQECDLSVYDKIYSTAHSEFGQRFLDTWNKNFGLTDLDYEIKLHIPPMEFEFESNKPRIAFHLDWNQRSYQKNKTPRNPQGIINALQKDFDVYPVGAHSHFDLNKNTSHDFLVMCGVIAHCDVFFGYPGGLHCVAAAVGTPTITTSEYLLHHFTHTGDFTGTGIEEFRRDFKLHAMHHCTDVPHILLEPEISDIEIIDYIKEHKTIFTEL